MNTNGMALTSTAAVRFGHKLMLARKVAGLSYRDAAEVAGLSAQYLNNIEKGTRPSPSSRVLRSIGGAYLLPAGAMDGLLFEARITSALEEFGVRDPAQAALYETFERLMSEAGHPVLSDVAEIIRLMLSR